MTKLSFDDGDGVWRTIGGRRIFIRTGESLSSAMKKSGKFKLSNKKKGEVRNENKSFNDIANESKDGKKDDLKNNYQKYVERKKQMENWLDETNNGKLSKYEEEALKYEREKHGEKAYQDLKKEFETGDDTFRKASASDSNDKEDKKELNLTQRQKETGEIKGFKKISENSFLPIRENETEEEVTKAYNERQEKYRRNLEPEVSKNLRDPRRLWDQDLVDTYIEMNEKGMVNEQKDKFTKDMKTMEGKPLYSPDRIKQTNEEINNNQITNALRRKAYQKYLREHPASKITFDDFKDMRNYIK